MKEPELSELLVKAWPSGRALEYLRVTPRRGRARPGVIRVIAEGLKGSYLNCGSALSPVLEEHTEGELLAKFLTLAANRGDVDKRLLSSCLKAIRDGNTARAALLAFIIGAEAGQADESADSQPGVARRKANATARTKETCQRVKALMGTGMGYTKAVHQVLRENKKDGKQPTSLTTIFGYTAHLSPRKKPRK